MSTIKRQSLFPCTLASLMLWTVLQAPATLFTWDGNGGDGSWSDANNWGGTGPVDGDELYFGSGFASGTTLNNDALSAVNSLIFLPPAGGLTLQGNDLTLTGGLTNLTGTAGRTVTINNNLAISGNQGWTTTNGNAVTVINGKLSGNGNLTFSTSTMQASGDGTMPVWRLSGDNSGYSGNISFASQRQGLALLNPGAMTAGNIDLGLGAVHGATVDRRFLYLSGSSLVNPFTFGIGAGAGQVSFNSNANNTGGLLHEGNQWLRLGGAGDYTWNHQTFYVEGRVSGTLGALTLGNATDRLILAGTFDTNVKTFKVDGSAIVDLRYGLDDTGLSGRTFRKTGTGLLILNTAAGGAQTTVFGIQSGAVSVSDMNQVWDGNLAIGNNNGSGYFIFNGITWDDFVADRSGGEGTGANQWRIMGSGSPGFAARGVDVTIDTQATTTATFNRDFTLGYSSTNLNGTLYANAAVEIAQNITLTANRTITLLGGNQESTTRWTVNSPVHEISGLISDDGGARILNLVGSDRQNPRNGTIRISNVNNSFTGGVRINSSSAGGAGGGGGVIAIFTDDSAFGPGNVYVGTGGSGAAGLLLFENQGAGIKDFGKAFEVALGGDASSGDSGFGSWAGAVRYNGTATITGNRTTLPVHVQAGSLRFGAGAQLVNNSSGAAQSYHKAGLGELIMDGNVTYGGSNPNLSWVLQQGTITTHAAGLLNNGSTSFNLNQIFGSSTAIGNGDAGYEIRRWQVRTQDHVLNAPGSGTFSGNITVDVAAGIGLTMNMGTATLICREMFGGGGGPNGFLFGVTKTGAGAWTYLNTSATTAASGNYAGYIKVDEGIFDVQGNMGRSSLWLSGGTLLAGDLASTPFRINRLQVDSDGGKIGISVNAADHVTRGAAFDGINEIWNLGGVGTVTLAARDNYDLRFTASSFPDIGAGETLLIERDGAGAGAVQLTDAALNVAGTLGGSGLLRVGGVAGTGTVVVAGVLAPGSSPGTLGLHGNLTLDTSEYLWELGDTALDYDSVVIMGNLVFNPGAAITLRLASSGSHVPQVSDTFILFGVTGGTTTGFDAGNWTFDYGTTGWTGGTVSQDGENVVLSGLTPVPEPATLALLGLGSALAAWRRRKPFAAPGRPTSSLRRSPRISPHKN